MRIKTRKAGSDLEKATENLYRVISGIIRHSLLDDPADIRRFEGADSMSAACAADSSIESERVDWNAVLREMKAQTIAVLPYKWVRETGALSEDIKTQWQSYCAMQQANWVRVAYAQDQLLKLLEENNIKCVIIKGSAAAMYYPQPSYRTAGDVDFLVKRSDYEKTAQLLEENGYAASEHKDPDFHHYGYKKNGISFELHRRLPIIRNDDEVMLSLFERGIDERVFARVESYTVPVLPPELNGLVLLFHIDQHLRSGLGLRQIFDWMMYVDKNDGFAELEPLLEKTGTLKLALSVTAMCQKYFGLRPFVNDVDQYPCESLMEYIIEKGNFGKKGGVEGKSASVFLDVSNPVRFFKRLQNGGLSRWKAAKKYRFLRPFAWIYQIFRLPGVLIHGKITPTEFVEQKKVGKRQRELIYDLGLDLERFLDHSEKEH